MEAGAKKITIRILVVGAFLVVISLGVSLAYLLWHPSSTRKGMPDELRVARIVSGGDRFSKSVFYGDPYLKVITDIKDAQKGDFLIAGERGAAFVTEQGSLKRSLHFEGCMSNVTAVDIEGGAFLCRGGWAMGTMLFGSDGRTLWSYNGGANGIDDAAGGILGPGDLERVVVGFNGSGGVRLLTADGKELWRREDDGNVWHVEIATTDKEPKQVILHSDVTGQLTMRDANGNVLGRYRPEIYLSRFSLTDWNSDLRRNKLVAARERFIYVMSMAGSTFARLPAPRNVGSPDVTGTQVQFSAGPGYASLLRHFLWNRSLLYIYDSQNRLVYHEVLDDACSALHAVAIKDAMQDLLVGCKGVVWKYSSANKP